MANLGRAFDIGGWMSGPELLLLAEFASKSKKILEVGSFRGRSTRALADNTDGQIVACDPWDGKYQYYVTKGIDCPDAAFGQFHSNGTNEIYSEFYMNLHDHIKNGKLRVFRCNFDELKIDEKFDFIFIDAIHEYEAVKADIAKALELIEPGGIIAGHDYAPGWFGVMQAVDEVFPQKQVSESIWSIQI